MTEDEARIAVRATLAVMTRLAEKTRTAADDLLLQILRSNEAKLTIAVHALAKCPAPPSPEQVAAALAAVGIHVRTNYRLKIRQSDCAISALEALPDAIPNSGYPQFLERSCMNNGRPLST